VNLSEGNLMIGKTISHYKILEKLGSGGMGEVYQGEDIKLKRRVALKFLSPILIQDSEAKQRFIQEAQAAATLNHPNICTIYEIDEADGSLFIAMELVKGQSLHERIKSGQISIDEAIQIGAQICQGLQEAHKHGIVHRDIKSSNIMIAENGQVKIMDFGLARSLGQTHLTKEGTSLGTVAYMSFEQACGQEIDHRTDIWSLGVVMYEMITGKLPFPGEADQVMIYSILNKEPVSITGLKSDVPKELIWIINRTLEKNPDERYQNASEICNDLKKVKQSSESKKENANQFPRLKMWVDKMRWPRKIWFVLAALFIGLIFLGVSRFLFRNQLSSPPKPIAVISFENQTGDESYDYLRKAIPNLLITNLEQSPHFNVTTWERMDDLLKQMGKEDVELIDRNMGFELCTMDGIETIVLGSFIKADDIFATDIKVLDVQSKQLLASASSRGNGVGSILEKQIDELSKSISLSMGLSEKTITATSTRILDVTTKSMEAYKHFLTGQENYFKNYFNDARQHLEKAIEIDTTFAVAYLYLAFTYDRLRNFDKTQPAYKKAKSHSPNATEKERLLIDATYAGFVEQRWEERLQILQELTQKYPQEKQIHIHLAYAYKYDKKYDEAVQEFKIALRFHPQYAPAINGLALTYAEMREYEKAIEYLRQYTEISPGDATPFASLGEIFFLMGRLDEAITQYNEALAIKPDIDVYQWLAYIYALQEDYPATITVLNQFISNTPSTGLKGMGCWWKGVYQSRCGCYHQAITDFDKAKQHFKSAGNEYGIAFADLTRAFIHFGRKNFELSKRDFENWLSYCKTGKHYWSDPFASMLGLGHVYIKEGDINAAKSKLHDARLRLTRLKERRDPDYTQALFTINLFHIELLLAEGDFKEAISIGEKNANIEFRLSWRIILWNLPFQQDALARAYTAIGELNKAIHVYEKLVSFTPGKTDLRLINPIYRYRLAKLYEEKGWPGKAIEQYQKLLEIWKHADEGLPEMVDAKARLAVLVEN